MSGVRRRGRADERLLARLVAAQKAEQAAARNVLLGCLARLLRAFGGEDTGRGSAATVPGLVDQLTARELEVLALLVPGTPARPYPLAAFATIRCGATVPAAGPGTTVPAPAAEDSTQWGTFG